MGVRATGYLVCDRCGMSVQFTGFADPERGEGWPMHRCLVGRISTIEPFSRFSDIDPMRIPLPKEPQKPVSRR